MPIEGDARAWDAMITARTSQGFVEAESHLNDVQAFERAVGLKLRDDPRARDRRPRAHAQRPPSAASLAEHREALRELFPLDGAAVLQVSSRTAGSRP